MAVINYKKGEFLELEDIYFYIERIYYWTFFRNYFYVYTKVNYWGFLREILLFGLEKEKIKY